MSAVYRPSGRVGVATWFIAPALVAASVVAGVMYAWGFEAIPIRWLVGLLPIFAAAGLGIAIDRGLTIAHVRSEGVGFFVGLACGCAFLAAGYIGLYSISATGGSNGVGFFAFLGNRLATGIALTTNFSIRGWLLGLLWAIEAICMLLAAVGGGFAAATRVYCELCESWANRDLWKFALKGVSSDALATIKNADSPQNALPRSHGGGDLAIEYAVRSCRCASTAALEVSSLKKTKDSVERTVLRESDSLTKSSLREILDWAERIDPAVSARRPNITLKVQHRPISDDPVIAAAMKPEGEHAAYYRWAKWLGASDSYVDNDFTRAIRQRLRNGDFLAAEEAVRLQRHPDDLAYVCEALADWDQLEVPGMSEWIDERPDSIVPRLIRGIHLVKVAWHKRGMGWQPKNFAEFQKYLRLADVELQHAASIAEGDPVSRAWLIYTAMGMQLPKSQAIARFEDATKRYPSHRPAYSFMIQCAASKWGGTEAMMLDFARRTAALPPGKSVHVAVAEAHLEAAFAAARETKDLSKIDEYFAQSFVRSELRVANERAFRSGSFKPTMDTPRTRQYFAYTLWRAGEKDAAAEHLRTFGQSSPWTLFSRSLFFWEGRDTIRRAKRDCGVR